MRLQGKKNELHISKSFSAFPWGPLLTPGGHAVEMHPVSVLKSQVFRATENLTHAAFLLDRSSPGTVEGRVCFLWLSGSVPACLPSPFVYLDSGNTMDVSPPGSGLSLGSPYFSFEFYFIYCSCCVHACVCGVSICVEKWLSSFKGVHRKIGCGGGAHV